MVVTLILFDFTLTNSEDPDCCEIDKSRDRTFS